MAYSRSERVGGIEVPLFERVPEETLQHGSYLRFLCIAIAGNRLLNGFGGIFGDFEALCDGRSDSDTLGAPQFQHGLRVFAVKRGLNGHRRRAVKINEPLQPFENTLQALGMALKPV